MYAVTPLAASSPTQHVNTRLPDPPVCKHHSPQAAWQACSVQQVALTECTALNKGQVGLVKLLHTAVQHNTASG